MDSKEKAELYPHTKKCLKTTEGKIRKSRNILEGNRKDLLEFLTKMKADGAEFSFVIVVAPTLPGYGLQTRECAKIATGI